MYYDYVCLSKTVRKKCNYFADVKQTSHSPLTRMYDDNKYCQNIDTINVKFLLYVLTDPS